MGTSTELSPTSWRPTVIGSHYAVSSGHNLATAAAIRALAKGGNAIDAGVTAALALAVVQPDVVSFAGVAPTLIYLKERNEVISLAGLGYWPAATDVGQLRAAGGSSIPDGILRQIIPAAPATHILALAEFGTFSFEEAATPAYELARDGFAVYSALRDNIEKHGAEIDRFPCNARIFRPDGTTPKIGDRFVQNDLARTFERLIGAERDCDGDRRKKLQAVRDFFYCGPIAHEIVDFHRKHGGFLRLEDLQRFKVPIEKSISTEFRGYTVHTCDVWCQGIVLLEALNIIRDDDVKALGHNSAAYTHLVAESLNLAFADREAYVGDPRFVEVPTSQLLSGDYAREQRKRISMQRAFGEMPAPGRVPDLSHTPAPLNASEGTVPGAPDTIYACVVDESGNAFSVTPSDSTYDSPMIDGLGFVPSTRGMQGRLLDDHPCSVEPGKRPRLTPTPAIALRDGHVGMVWGTPWRRCAMFRDAASVPERDYLRDGDTESC
jgi:gamma-glutamyltranspeptidase / glutathione hydrolase